MAWRLHCGLGLHPGLEVSKQSPRIDFPKQGCVRCWLSLIICLSCSRVDATKHRPEPADESSATAARPVALEAPTDRVRGGERDAPYPLDALGRTVPDTLLRCPEVDARDFVGLALEFVPPARVIEPFRERLVQFEQVVSAAALELYGRAPSKVLVSASYDCRSVKGKSRRLSEHALGNAIDVAGFDFLPSPNWPAVATPLPGAFEVRVDRHWKAKGDPAIERHARFLEQLTRDLVARHIFRTLLGPAEPEHADHFHFDMAPSPHVNL